MKNYRGILKLNLNKEDAQSIAEYSILFVAIVAVLIFAINGPVRSSLQGTFQGLIDAISTSVDGLIE